ncbi:MAG: tRNA guanosine(34) transglycosylase Tgt [Phycisphaerae bacterium]|nr:tRNA guanosine(34) transglycosylase Tgt [Phycisphaerae bacterium]
MALRFDILARSSSNRARLGRVTTLHGSFDTPAFMPVATAAAMKGVLPAEVRATGAQIILNNAYHLLLRVGVERMRRLGGSHELMRWDGPMLTDSGGFQAYSMSGINKVDDGGVTFRSFIDGSTVRLGPKESMAIQNAIGADIIMAFDDCPPSQAPKLTSEPLDTGLDQVRYRARVLEAHDRTLRWLEACRTHHARADEQSLFGIVQGGTDLDLRRRSIDGVCAVELPGYAIGGVAVGEGRDEIRRVVEFSAPQLPSDKPRYLMGVGYPRDIVMAVAAGVDMFDCVLPTRNGRNAYAFTRHGSLRLRNACHAEDRRPIEEDCDCVACGGGFSRAYLRHLFSAEEMLGPILVTLHNLRLYQRLMLDIRCAIKEDAWSSFLAAWPVAEVSAREPWGDAPLREEPAPSAGDHSGHPLNGSDVRTGPAGDDGELPP